MVGPPVRGPGDAAGGVQPDAGADAGAGVDAWLAALELDEFDELTGGVGREDPRGAWAAWLDEQLE